MTQRLEIVLWCSTLALASAAIVGWRGASLKSADARFGLPPVHDAAPPPTASRLEILASRIVARDPFRLDRKPAAVAFGAMPAMAPAHATPAPRPALLLSGVFGPPWQAVLEGIPGKQGSVVVRAGDAFGELRIRSIRRDTVVVQGADTTWKLTVRRLW